MQSCARGFSASGFAFELFGTNGASEALDFLKLVVAELKGVRCTLLFLVRIFGQYSEVS